MVIFHIIGLALLFQVLLQPVKVINCCISNNRKMDIDMKSNNYQKDLTAQYMILSYDNIVGCYVLINNIPLREPSHILDSCQMQTLCLL